MPRNFTLPVRELSPEALLEGDLLAFLGHGTVWLRVGSCALLFDPILGPIGGVVRRRTPPPLPPEALPRPDLVLVSHAHLDHLDRGTLRALPAGFRVVCGLGAGRYLEGFPVVELDWLDEARISGIRVTALPAQHWSQRTLLDHNRALWVSYMVEVEGLRVFFGGDTGYFEGFREIGEEFGPFDLALLPCGAYEPRDLMAFFHLAPGEAVRAARALRARLALPIHWGAYALGDEPPEDPPRLFAEEARKEGLAGRVLFPGEILRL